MAKATIFISRDANLEPQIPDSQTVIIPLAEHFHVLPHGALVLQKLQGKLVVWSNTFGKCFMIYLVLGNRIIYKQIQVSTKFFERGRFSS